jgi:hypothetical protein
MFDGGDARCRNADGSACTNTPGTVTILPPTEATGDFTGSGTTANNPRCRAEGNVVGVSEASPSLLTNCQLTGVLNGATPNWNGKTQRVRVPIPLNYGCAVADPLGCWFRLRVCFPDTRMQVTDQTTWTATLDGDPVRLVK